VYAGGTYEPTQRELSLLYGVSVSSINRATQLSAEQRPAVAAEQAKLPAPVARPLALPKPNGNGNLMDDATLFVIVRNAGVDKVLSIAAQVDQAAHH